MDDWRTSLLSIPLLCFVTKLLSFKKILITLHICFPPKLTTKYYTNKKSITHENVTHHSLYMLHLNVVKYPNIKYIKHENRI